MATKSLGSLTVNMLLETAGFEEGMTKAERIAAAKSKAIERQAAQSAKAIEMAWSNMARTMAVPLAGAFSVAGVTSMMRSLSEAQQQADKLRNSLNFSTNGNATREITYLRETAAKLGLDFTSAATAYGKFAAATKGTGITAEQTREIFEGVAAASSKMGLSADETSGALLALSQMASKGKVAAEELRGQLGERLPGALKLAAQAMGVTQAELGKMMESGNLIASDFLPKFGRVLKDEFGGSVGGLTQELNRLNSAWDQWKQSFSRSDGGLFRWITEGLNESAAAMRNLGDEAGVVAKIFAASGGFQAGALGFHKFDTQQMQKDAFEKLAEYKKVVKELEDQTAKYGSLPPITQDRLDSYRAKVKAVREEIMQLAALRGKETGIQLPDLAGEYAAQKAKIDERLKAYFGDTANAPKAAKIAAAVEKENQAFQTAVAGLQETDSKYIAALKAHNARIAEITKPDKSSISAGQQLIENMRTQLAAAQDLSAVDRLQVELSDKKYSKITDGEREIAISLAQQIDYRKQIEQQLDDEIDAARKRNAEYAKEANRLQSLIGQTQSGKDAQRWQDEGIALSALKAGKINVGQYDEIISKLRETKDVNADVKDSFKELGDLIEGWGKQSADAIVEFTSGAQTSFRDMTTSILKDIARMMVYQNVTKPAASWLSGMAGSLFGSMFGSGSTIPMQPGGGYAKGAAFSDSTLHQYVNTVQTSPKAFSFGKLHGFANGGVFAEAGPEAVMPLARDQQGRLGVRAQGSSGDVNVSITINDNSTTSEKTTGNGSDVYRQLGQRIKAVVVDEIATQKRPGGLLYGA